MRVRTGRLEQLRSCALSSPTQRLRFVCSRSAQIDFSLPYLLGLHPRRARRASSRTSETFQSRAPRASSPVPSALRPIPAATMASADFSLRTRHRRPFSHKARSPQVRTHSFAAQPPDLRHLALITRASRFVARSPCSAAPSIRFLSIGSQLRSTLPPHTRSPSCSCASLRSL